MLGNMEQCDKILVAFQICHNFEICKGHFEMMHAMNIVTFSQI